MAKLNCQSRLEISVSVLSPIPQLSAATRFFLNGVLVRDI